MVAKLRADIMSRRLLDFEEKEASSICRTEFQIRIRNFTKETDLYQVKELERRCETGPSGAMSLYADLLGDPLCRVRHFPSFAMLVAEQDAYGIVGLVRAGVKDVVCGRKSTLNKSNFITKTFDEVPVYARVGYILGLRVCPHHRRVGIGLQLAQAMEDWCKEQGAEYVYMATERSNLASINLFTSRLGYREFRKPRILVQPVFLHHVLLPHHVRITKLSAKDALTIYTYFTSKSEFFPKDFEDILKHDLYEGTWLATLENEEEDNSHAHYEGSNFGQSLFKGNVKSWAILSIWKCNEIFKLQVDGVSVVIRNLAAITRFVDGALPWLKIPSFPDLFSPFGMQFMFGIDAGGVKGHDLLYSLCWQAHNVARKHGCQVLMTELNMCDPLQGCIPHWKCLSSTEDLWCIKRLRNGISEGNANALNLEKASLKDSFDWCKSADEEKLFVDPRDV